LLLAATSGITFGIEFSSVFAGWLDPATSATDLSGSHDLHQPPSPPVSDDDGTQTVSTTVQEDYSFGAYGSVATLRLTGTIAQTVTDDKTHAVLAQFEDARSYTGKIDVCPGVAGDVPASVTVSIRITGATTSATDQSEGTFGGHVNDSAALTSVTAAFDHTVNWKSSQGTGSLSLQMSNISLPGSATGVSVGSMDISNVQASESLSGIATDANATQAAGGDGLTMGLMEPVFAAAQKLWRNGRCVVVTAPDYKAETPISVSQQGQVQHTEEVDKGSDTKFAAALRHRFSSVPTAPIDAALSGDKSITPEHAPAAPTSITYTAGDKDDAKADVTLVSTSKRGIGKLVLEFKVKPKKLKLTADGTLTVSLSAFTITAAVHVPTVTFADDGSGTLKGTASTSANITEHVGPLTCTGTETGTIDMQAERVEVSGTETWQVRANVQPGHATLNMACPGASVSGYGFSQAGYGPDFLSNLGTVTIPADGGTVPVHKTIPKPGGIVYNDDATIMATVGQS
ncbi:MAG TPA: hypothetical protein VFA84_06470, partial [Acidimicrobiales bacterium]|nr:hypothetical protein [Acidimicrobiales bacterium]